MSHQTPFPAESQETEKMIALIGRFILIYNIHKPAMHTNPLLFYIPILPIGSHVTHQWGSCCAAGLQFRALQNETCGDIVQSKGAQLHIPYRRQPKYQTPSDKSLNQEQVPVSDLQIAWQRYV